MPSLIRLFLLAPLLGLVVACGGGSDAEDAAANEAGAKRAHEAYVAAINSNNIDQFAATITDDVVYVPPNSEPLVGKAAVVAFGKGYFEAYHTVWEKTSLDFTVSDSVAYETYHYKSVDTPRDDGPAAGTGTVIDTGTGLNVYRRGSDGVWRVARDAWATDRPVATP